LYPSLWRSCTKLSPATRPDNRSMKGFCFLWLWPLFFSFLQAQADIIYDPWDWVTYRFSQDIASISDGPEHVYFASPGGILRYQTFGRYWDFPITTSQGLSDFTVTAIYYDFHTHMLWASTPQGLDYSMDGGGRWSKVSRDELGLRDREVIIRIGSTAEELFCVTPSQILKADHLSGFLIMSYSEPPPKDQITWGSSLMIGTAAVRDIVDGFTAMGGWNLELGWLNGPSLNEKAPITTVHTDRFGDMWVGTRGGPVFRGDQQLMILEPKPVGLAQTNATVLEFWGTSLWVAGVSAPDVPSGITLLDTDRSTSELFRRGVEISFGLDAVTAIEKVGKQWWFGTPDGIQIYDPQKDTWTVFSKVKTLIDETISHLKTDGEYIYVGTRMGVVRVSVEKGILDPWPVTHDIGRWPSDALEWDGSNLWVSSRRHLWRWFADADFFYQYGSFGEELTGIQPGEATLMSPVTAVVSSDSMVYFADEFGLLIYNKTEGKWDRYTAESKLVGYRTLDMDVANVDDSTTVAWLATTNGAVMVNFRTGFVRQFGLRDGLPSQQITAVRVEGDQVWLGTAEGLCRFKWLRYLQ